MELPAEARERIILALDFPSAASTFRFLESIQTELPATFHPLWVKLGLELFLAEGPAMVGRLRESGYQVFLDLKLHDIPNTVAGAVRSILPLDPALLTVHAVGGPEMLAAAASAAAGSPTRLLAVTVLTSMNAVQLAATGVPLTPEAQVQALAVLAHNNGIDGLVCSPRETAALQAMLPGSHLVTPGIRPGGAASGDQQRVATPTDAIRAGASQIVVGRPITAVAHPAVAWKAMLLEVAGVLGMEK